MFIMSIEMMFFYVTFEGYVIVGFEGETAVMKAIVKWLEDDVEGRLTHFTNILGSIRINSVCPKFLDGFTKTPVVQENQGDIADH